ncbi:hypothetical protein AB6A23_18780 [Paenibacillus tarimensis]
MNRDEPENQSVREIQDEEEKEKKPFNQEENIPMEAPGDSDPTNVRLSDIAAPPKRTESDVEITDSSQNAESLKTDTIYEQTVLEQSESAAGLPGQESSQDADPVSKMSSEQIAGSNGAASNQSNYQSNYQPSYESTYQSSQQYHHSANQTHFQHSIDQSADQSSNAVIQHQTIEAMNTPIAPALPASRSNGRTGNRSVRRRTSKKKKSKAFRANGSKRNKTSCRALKKRRNQPFTLTVRTVKNKSGLTIQIRMNVK